MGDDLKIKIEFSFTDILGHKYSASSFVEVFNELGETELYVIGKKLNAFLVQIGYVRQNNCMLMEDLTEEEYYALCEYLKEIRAKVRGSE